MADHRHGLAGWDAEIDIEQDLPPGLVAKADMLEAYRARSGPQFAGIGGILNLAILLQQMKHALDVGQRLPNLAVEHPKMVKGHVKLNQEGIDQYDVTDRHAAVRDSYGGLPHHQRDAAGNDQRLAEVEIGERYHGTDLDRFPLPHMLVVALQLPALVIEILDRLIVDQTVDGARVGGGVEFIGLAPDLGSPVGDGNGEQDIQTQSGQGDGSEHGGVTGDQDAENEGDLDQRRQYGVDRVADQAAHRPGATFDVAGEAAGLSFQMKAQRQGVQVFEYLQGDRTLGALRHAGKNDLPQFGEQSRREAQQAVGTEQPKRHQQERLVARDGQGVDDVLEHQGHGHIGQLGSDQAGECEYDAAFPLPQVGQQRFDGLPVPAVGGFGTG